MTDAGTPCVHFRDHGTSAGAPKRQRVNRSPTERVWAAVLADMIGTTRSRVSFFMNKFRKLGLIDYNGCIEVRSSLLNVVLHDEPHIEI